MSITTRVAPLAAREAQDGAVMVRLARLRPSNKARAAYLRRRSTYAPMHDRRGVGRGERCWFFQRNSEALCLLFISKSKSRSQVLGGAFLPRTICGARRAQREARGARSAWRARRACRTYGRTSARSSLADRGARGASRRARPSRRARADDDARPGPFFFGSPRSCDRNASVWFSCSDFWTCDFQVWVSVTDRHTHALKGVRVGVPPSTKKLSGASKIFTY